MVSGSPTPGSAGPAARSDAVNALFRNATYAAGQTVIIVAYGVLFFADSGPYLYDARFSRVVGLVCCAAGLLLGALGFVALRSVIQIAPQPRDGGRLITSGVYGRFRHPMYTAIVLVAIGLFLRKPTSAIGAANLAVIAFMVVKSRYEERLLAERYADYAAYKRHTFGVIPLLT